MNKIKLNNRIIGIIEDCGFNLEEITKQDDKYYIEIGQYTPLGQDWHELIWFDGTDEGFINGIEERLYSFDIYEEAEVWIEARGTNGVPESIKELVEDQEWKEDKLDELVRDLDDMKITIASIER